AARVLERPWFRELQLMPMRELREAPGLIELDEDARRKALEAAPRGDGLPSASWLELAEAAPNRFWCYPEARTTHFSVFAPLASNGGSVLRPRSLTWNAQGELVDVVEHGAPCLHGTKRERFTCQNTGCPGPCIGVWVPSPEGPQDLFHCHCQ